MSGSRLGTSGYGLGGNEKGVPPLQRPDYTVIVDLLGGINTSKPPDQLDPRESPDMNNLIYVNKVLCVDFGFKALGSAVFGQPQQTIQWFSNNRTVFNVLVTTQLVYTYNFTNKDWVPVPSSSSPAPTTNALVNGAGTNPSFAFTGSATWVTNQNIAVKMNNNQYLVGPASGTTSPVTLGTPLPVGRSVAASSPIIATQNLNGLANSPVTWVGDPIRNSLIISNSQGPLKEFNGATCVTLPGSPQFTVAGPIARFHNVLVVGGTVEGGVLFPYRIRRSATGDSTNWTTLDSGFDDLTDTNDVIVGLMPINPYLAVIRRRSIVRASYYGIGVQVFWYDYGLSTTGSLGAQSFAQTKTDSVVVAESGAYTYKGDYGLQDISEKIFDSLLSYTGELNPSAQDAMFVLYIEVLDETWIFYPDSSNSQANKILRYKHRTGAWFKRTLTGAVSLVGAGRFNPQSDNSWQSLVGTRWIDRHRPWNARSNKANYSAITLCAQGNQVYLYDFNTTTTDNGLAIPWYYNSKDYPIPDNWETIDGLVFYGKGIVDLVEISTDFGRSFTPLGSNLNLGPTWNRVDFDTSITAQFIRLRFSGVDPSFKLSWFAFKTMFATER